MASSCVDSASVVVIYSLLSRNRAWSRSTARRECCLLSVQAELLMIIHIWEWFYFVIEIMRFGHRERHQKVFVPEETMNNWQIATSEDNSLPNWYGWSAQFWFRNWFPPISRKKQTDSSIQNIKCASKKSVSYGTHKNLNFSFPIWHYLVKRSILRISWAIRKPIRYCKP